MPNLFKKRRGLRLVGVYLLLLLASSAARFEQPKKLFPAEKKSITVAAINHDQQSVDFPVSVAYREFASASQTNELPILLLHGSPGDSESLTGLAGNLSRTRRVIVPDLPGFGDSTRNIPDYSFRAHAFYLKQLAEKLKLERFHLLAFSMGGGTALNLAEIAPERIASIEMVSAIGVQEYELLGDYRLNHVLHGAQLAAIWALQNLTPHFGLLDGAFFGTSYARNFYDSDQRPLRSILKIIEQPVLIIHGRNDPLVPVQAAREHHRLVPQSEYVELDENHFMIFQHPDEIAPIVEDFLNRVENSGAQSKSNADSEKIAAAGEPFVREMVMADGSTALVYFLILALGTFVSEDLTSITAGALVGEGQISLWLAVGACFGGILGGDLLIYLAGRFFGRAAVAGRPFKWFISESSLNRGAAWLERNGMNAVFLSRVTPGLRLPVYFAAGMLETNFLRFAVYFAVAAALWTPILIIVTAWASRGMTNNSLMPGHNFWLEFIGLIGAAFVILNLLLHLATWRGRRRLAGSWLRLTRWEFWSLQMFYLPVIFYVAWLGLKFRSLSVFADANPAIAAGGFIGEQKQLIYEGLRQSPAATAHLLRYALISSENETNARIMLAENFIAENNLNFTVALKPNAGERGNGVFIIKNEDELKKRIEANKADLIVQEFAAGVEFGVFYYRYPNEETGKIFAVTEKKFPFVTGDGEATLETLILRGRRTVALADAYFERNAERLADVPRAGEKVFLIDIGTHSKGAIFLDGEWAKTDALEEKIDRICRGYKGFYFGRFDLRSPSVEDFKRGDFKIIELNGVTSEATNIYDPKNSLLGAYRVLFRQWRIAFEIGAQNRALGAPQTTVGDLLKLYYRSRFGQIKQFKSRNPSSEIENVPDSFRL